MWVFVCCFFVVFVFCGFLSFVGFLFVGFIFCGFLCVCCFLVRFVCVFSGGAM